MEILGVGIPEMAFIVLIALILLGPKDMIAASRTLGSFLRKFLTSPTWLAMRRTGEELQQLPTKLVREAGLEELQKEVQSVTNQIKPPDFKKVFDERQILDPKPQPPAADNPPGPLAGTAPVAPAPVKPEMTPEPPPPPEEI